MRIYSHSRLPTLRVSSNHSYEVGWLQSLVIAANIGSGLVGAVAIVAGAFFQHVFSGHLRLLHERNDLRTIAFVLIIVGILVLCMSTIGAVSVSGESQMITRLYCVLLGVFAFLELAVGCIALLRVNVIQQMLEGYLRQLWAKKNDHMPFWNALQFVWSCCGLESREDWDTTPFSCCNPMNSLYFLCYGDLNAHKTPCVQALHTHVSQYSHIFGLAAIGLGVMHILVIAVTAWLAITVNRLRNKLMVIDCSATIPTISSR